MAQVLGQKFDIYLMKVLHPLLEKLGDPSGLVSCSAYITLQRICRHCSYPSLPALIARNTDYLIDSISMNMKYLSLYPSTPQVLQAILQYCILPESSHPGQQLSSSEVNTDQTNTSGSDIVWLLDDTIGSVFNGLDDHNVQYTLSFLKILHAIVCVLALKYEKKNETSQKPPMMPNNSKVK